MLSGSTTGATDRSSRLFFLDVTRWLVLSGLVAAASHAAGSQEAAAQPVLPATPAEMFAAWCARCHGADGRGQVAEPTVSTRPMDFTDCALATGEPDADWMLVIAQGGPAAGLSPEMPAFGEALDEQAIRGLVQYLRTFCREPGWPHGNLNLPRPLLTEKAFPENELVILPAISHGRDQRVTTRVRTVVERRFGRRSHAEIALPLESVTVRGTRTTGLGDLAVAAKHVLHVNAAASRILTAGMELTLPTGRATRQLRTGAAVIEPYLAVGALRGSYTLQGQLTAELPLHGGAGDLGYRVYVGRDLRPTPSTWTVGIELDGVEDQVALVPQVRKGLTRTGALAAAGGVRWPVTQRGSQPIQWIGYVLWEYREPVRARR